MKRIVIARLLLAAAGLLLAPGARARTSVCGDICNQTWTAAGSPYIVTCAVRVTETSADPAADCDALPVVFYLAKDVFDFDYGAATGGERRDLMGGAPCP